MEAYHNNVIHASAAYEKLVSKKYKSYRRMNFYNNKASLLNTFELQVYTTDMTRRLYTIAIIKKYTKENSPKGQRARTEQGNPKIRFPNLNPSPAQIEALKNRPLGTGLKSFTP